MRGEQSTRCAHVNERGRRCEMHKDHLVRHSIFGSKTWCQHCGDLEVRDTLKTHCGNRCKRLAEEAIAKSG